RCRPAQSAHTLAVVVISPDRGSARRGHAPAAALSCKPRVAPAGAGFWHAPGPPYDHGGHRPHEPRTPTPTRSHRAHAAPRQADARPCRPPTRPTAAPTATCPTPRVQYAKLGSIYMLSTGNLRLDYLCVTSP